MRKRKNPLGLILHPHGVIERHTLDVESSLIWGEKEKAEVTFCWLTPPRFRNSNKGKYVILPSLSLQGITFPDEPRPITDFTAIQRAYRERYHAGVAHASSRNRLTTSLVLISIVTALMLVLIVVMFALGIPQIIQEFASNSATDVINNNEVTNVIP